MDVSIRMGGTHMKNVYGAVHTIGTARDLHEFAKCLKRQRWATSALAKIVLTVSASVVVPVAFASGWSGTQYPATVDIEGGAEFIAYPPSGSNFNNPDACGQSNVVILESTDSGYQQELAALLAAQAEGAKVQFWLSGCVNSPWGYTVPHIYSISVYAP